MPNNQQKINLKNQIKDSISRNSDCGYVPYEECIRVCDDMMSIIQMGKLHGDQRQNFDMYIIVFLEAVKLYFYSDATSGAITDLIEFCLTEIDKLCKNADKANQKYFFSTITKSVKIKAFRVWPDYGYKLLKYAVCFITNKREAQKVYDIFPILGKIYDGEDYPDKLLIERSIIERLEGKKAAKKYLLSKIHVPEIRIIVIQNSLATKNYSLAEKLCIEALKKNEGGYFYRLAPWIDYLQKIYTETANLEKLSEIVQLSLLDRNSSYFEKILGPAYRNWGKLYSGRGSKNC